MVQMDSIQYFNNSWFIDPTLVMFVSYGFSIVLNLIYYVATNFTFKGITVSQLKIKFKFGCAKLYD